MKKLILIATLFLVSCDRQDKIYSDINLRIVNFNSDCSLSDDKLRNPQLCNAILFETIEGKKLYMEINTCKNMTRDMHIDTKWLYNHRVGDTVHFDYLLKERFFTIEKR